MIKRIRVKGYKSLQDVEVVLQPLSVLFGPNSAGKSNFLDVLQLLSNIATSRTLKEAFAPPYRGQPLESFTFGPEGVQGLVAQESASFSVEVDVELSPGVVDAVNRLIRDMRKTKSDDGGESETVRLASVREQYLRYRIDIEIQPKSGILRVTDEYLAALSSDGQVSKKRNPFLEGVGDRLHLRMEGQAHPTYYDRYLDHSMLSLPLYPPHYPHLVAVRQELASWFFFYFEPRERMRAANPVKEVRHIGLMGQDLAAFLNTLRALDERQFRNIERSLHMIIPSMTGIDVSVSLLGEVELRLLEGGTPVPARVLSEGTLRVLGLLALGGAKDPVAVVGFEEPENGIHPRRVRLIAEHLKTRAASGTQLIVTTHSLTLLDLLPDESLYVVRKIGGRTEVKPFTDWGWGGLGRSPEIRTALDAEEGTAVTEEGTAVTKAERVLRGDFDA